MKNKIARFLIYHFTKAYERKYSLEFVKTEREELLKKSGIEIEKECSVLFRATRILKGIRS